MPQWRRAHASSPSRHAGIEKEEAKVLAGAAIRSGLGWVRAGAFTFGSARAGASIRVLAFIRVFARAEARANSPRSSIACGRASPGTPIESLFASAVAGFQGACRTVPRSSIGQTESLFASAAAGFGGACRTVAFGAEATTGAACTIAAVAAVAASTTAATTAAVVVGEVAFMATNASADLPHP